MNRSYKTYGLAGLFMLCLFVLPSAIFAQAPSNDECSGATVITTLPDTISQNTRLATANAGDPVLHCGDGGGGKTVWFKYTADSSQYYTFTTRESSPADYDLVIAIFSGSCGTLHELACNDDIVAGSVRQAEMTFRLEKDSTYTIMVGEWKGGGPSGGVPTGGDLVFRVFRSGNVKYVQGPRTGHVASGGLVNTNSFTDMGPFPPPLSEGREAAENRRTKLLPLPAEAPRALAPRGANFKEDRLTEAVQTVVTPPHATLDFKGFDNTGYLPPDVIMAVGPNHIVGMVNSTWRIYDKSGSILKTIDCNQWWSNVRSPVQFSDPQVLYDQYSHRWIMVGISAPPSGANHVYLSISDDDNPFGAWYNYVTPGGAVGDSSVVSGFSDHPQIGLDSVGFYITTRGGAFGSRVMIFDKNQLYADNGGPMTWTDFWDFRDPLVPSTGIDWPKPSIMFGPYPGKHFLVNTSPYDIGTFVMVWTINDPVGNPTVTGADIPVVEYKDAPDPSQYGGNTFEGSGGVMQHKAVYRDSSLWMVHNVAIGDNDEYSGVHYLRVNPFTDEDQEDVVLGKSGYWCFYPSIMVNSSHDLLIGFNRTGTHEYAGAYFTGRRGSDPPSLSPSMPLKEGLGNYYVPANNRNRWGDYNGIALDPTDSSTFWLHTEWAAGLNNWGTWMGKIDPAPYSGKRLLLDHSAAPFGTYETGENSDTVSFVLANGGTDPVTVSSIVLPDTNFTYFGLPSAPFQINPGSSLSFAVSFAPKVRGTYSDTIRLTTDDPALPVVRIAISGVGYSIAKAQKGIMYAVSGNSGKVYSVNPSNGATTLIGGSGYEKIVSARVNMNTKTLVGFVSPSSMVRVSAELGDAHPLLILKQATVSVKGMVYRGDTILLGQGGGGIYRLDEIGDTLVQVASTGLGIAGMDFSPITGDLWISVRTGTLDAIYKMKFPNGTPQLVGRTGFNTVTQDIIFDGVGNLYGVIGTGSSINSLIKIDTTNGHGTMVGSMGVPIVQGLAWIPDSLLGVAAFGVVPTDTIGSRSLSLDNTGPDTLHILSVGVSDAASYSVSTAPQAIPPGGTVAVDIDFHPATAGNKNGKITFTTDSLHRDLVIGLSGTAIRRGTVTSSYLNSWNLVSVPVVTDDYSLATLFPGSTGSAYSYNGTYNAASMLANGTGYWLKFTGATSVGFPGTYTLSDSISVSAGWNLVGALTHGVPAYAASGVHTGSLSPFFGFDHGYQAADSILPGKGYWVRADSAGTIVLSNAGGPGPGGKEAVRSIAALGLNVLHISDAAGMRQDLYFGVKADGMPAVRSFELPPPPPEGVFDARFASGRNGEYIEQGSAAVFPVKLLSAVYPVTLAWEIADHAVDCELRAGGSVIALSGSGSEVITRDGGQFAIATSGSKAIPAKFALGQNYPNPFNPSTRIQYELASDVHVTLKIYDVLGREVAELVNENQQAGYKSVEWNASAVPSGVYFYRIQAGAFSDSKKLMLVR